MTNQTTIPNVTTLGNGLRVVTNAIPHVETVTCGLWVNVGARHEPAPINGISHVLEHMAFKGTTRRSALQIAEEIEAVGGYLNAYTSREATAYHARVLKDNVPLAIDILADILQDSTFDATEFAREQSVIIQEIGQTFDTPDDIIFDYFQETCYPDQPIGRAILGTAEVVRSLTPTQVKTYMQDHYGAHQMVFAAAGNLDHQEIVRLVAEKFSRLPIDCPKEARPAVYKGGTFHQRRDLEQTHLVLGYEGLPFGHPDHYAVSILSTILGGGMSSRLFQEVREKRGLVYSIYTFASSYQDSGVFGVYAGADPKQINELLPVVQEELSRFPNSLETSEMDRAKAQLKAGLMMSLESTTSRCEQLANHLLIYGRPIPPKEILEKVDAVTLDQVTSLAKRLFAGVQTQATLGPSERI
ncbi:MAG: ptrA [Alphaproteobacteria bacterium]|jgi:predicted Zn-dependent peptidase|nr:ptrA [Alphaproteobacteria bacterium]